MTHRNRIHVGAFTISLRRSYNHAGQPTTTTLPNGTTVSHEYDRMGRTASIASDWVDAQHPAVLAQGFEYHPGGGLAKALYGNGTQTLRTYTSGGLLKTLQHGTPAVPGELLDLEYQYLEGLANNGRIARIDDRNDPTRSLAFTYDSFQRIESAQTDGPHWGLNWSYDRYGNRLAQTLAKGSAPQVSLGVDPTTNRVDGWLYDEAGNVLDDGRHAYARDAQNHITAVDGSAAVYRYGPGGERVTRIQGGETTHYFFGRGEYVAGLGWSKLYVHHRGEKLAEFSGGTTRFFHADHRRTPVRRTALDGSLTGSWDLLPFGESLQPESEDGHRFTGHLRDGETGNDYAGARYYAGTAGRWLSSDPVIGRISNPQRLNRFSYVLNDPVNYVDPDGREGTPLCQGLEESGGSSFFFGCLPLLYDPYTEAEIPQVPRTDSGGDFVGPRFLPSNRNFSPEDWERVSNAWLSLIAGMRGAGCSGFLDDVSIQVGSIGLGTPLNSDERHSWGGIDNRTFDITFFSHRWDEIRDDPMLLTGILAHELYHGLQNQRFGVLRWIQVRGILNREFLADHFALFVIQEFFGGSAVPGNESALAFFQDSIDSNSVSGDPDFRDFEFSTCEVLNVPP